jgi:hypothetical protein
MFVPPFTVGQFFTVFADYNSAIWPLHIVGYGLGVLAVLALWVRAPLMKRAIPAALAILWAVNGVGYHLLFFVEINPIASLFAAVFLFQAILFAASALVPNDLRFELAFNVRSAAGLSFIVYALVIYELLGYWAGHGLMAGPIFGVAPCPTTIFTIGMLLLARGRWAAWLSVIPILWSLIGLAAALQLGIPEDFGLPAAGAALGIGLVVRAVRGRSSREPAEGSTGSINARASP